MPKSSFVFHFPTYVMILSFQICKKDSKAKTRKRTISMRSLDQHYMFCHRQNVLYVDIFIAIVVIASWYVAKKKTITLIEAFKTKIRADFCIHMWDFFLNFQLIFFRKCFEYFKCWFSTWAFVVVVFVKPMLVSFT